MRRSTAVTWLMMLLLLCGGCARDETPAENAETPQANEASALRIVSLSPAISRTLADLGLAGQIVGRTPFCASVDRATPIVGDLHNLDYEQLVRVKPTHVLVQPPASGLDSELVQLASQRNWQLHTWRLNDIADIEHMLSELPEALDRPDLREDAASLRGRIDEASQPDATWTQPTLIIANSDPISAFGSGTYMHDILTALGGVNAATQDNYPQFTLEDIVRMNPAAIVLVRPGASAGADAADSLGPLVSLEIDAVRTGRVAVLRHADAYLPSSALVEVADELRAILRDFADEVSQQ